MFDCKYKVYINGLWFDALYGADYYDDKRMFYASGAKQFFTIYQILKTGDYVFTLIAEDSGQKTESLMLKVLRFGLKQLRQFPELFRRPRMGASSRIRLRIEQK